jgi:hypothetical protein
MTYPILCCTPNGSLYTGYRGDECHDNAANAQRTIDKAVALESRVAQLEALLSEASDAIDQACYPVWWESYRAALSGAPEAGPSEADEERCFGCEGPWNGGPCPVCTAPPVSAAEATLAAVREQADRIQEAKGRPYAAQAGLYEALLERIRALVTQRGEGG